MTTFKAVICFDLSMEHNFYCIFLSYAWNLWNVPPGRSVVLLKTAGWLSVLRVVSESVEQMTAAFLAQVVASFRDKFSQHTNSHMW